MKLNTHTLLNHSEDLKTAGFELPIFNLQQIKESTKSNPKWIHFGAGNIFRAYIANCCQTILNKNAYDCGILAVETFDNEVITKAYRPFDNLTALVKTKASGEFVKTIVASIAETVVYTDEKQRIEEAFLNSNLQLVSFTVTEKGYSLHTGFGKFFPFVEADIDNGPNGNLAHLVSIITALLYKRFTQGAAPLAMVSMDNCSHNGDILKSAVCTIAEAWKGKGFVDERFLNYLNDDHKVSFPLSMIDKITPRPSESIKQHLAESGLENMDIIVTNKNTYTAGFVNAEFCEYLVIEDKFPNGRPELEQAGVIFTDRETVNKVETMKVTTCLNPLHTALAVSGVLLGYQTIWEEMKDADLVNLVEKIGYEEGLKVVIDPKILSPKTFIDEVLQERFPNATIPDAPQRIATDTSQKVGIRFGETIKKYMADDTLSVDELEGIPMALALWCRYLVGIDDKGNEMQLSSDPMLDELRESLKEAKIGHSVSIAPILGNAKIFNFNIMETSVATKAQRYFDFMLAETGNARKALQSLSE
ncbi:MAG: mannitol dehydrogenase family protein [Mangrovibacterium sp.]